jgi:hypothetical protein
MRNVDFPQANSQFKAPESLSEIQVRTAPAFVGRALGGSMDGTPMVVVAWQPDPDELEILNAGGPVFLTVMGGLPPHFLTCRFTEATRPA